jgi:molybdate transport system regulatory protein
LFVLNFICTKIWQALHRRAPPFYRAIQCVHNGAVSAETIENAKLAKPTLLTTVEAPNRNMNAIFEFRLCLQDDPRTGIGPEHIGLLEAVDETGSIAGAARTVRLTYGRAKHLICDVNDHCSEASVQLVRYHGSKSRMMLTSAGREVVRLYRAWEQRALESGASAMCELDALLAPD